MRRTVLIIACLPLLLLATSCTYNPRMVSGTESDYLLQLRQEYLNSNPDGEYNEYIKRGEVVKGMDFLEVLAAWGHPERRKKDDSLTEHWVYHEFDETSKDAIWYTFTFRRNILAEWSLSREFADGGRVDVPDGNDVPSLTRGDYSKAGEVPKKR